MFPIITSELIHMRQQDLLREAERQHVAAGLSEPGRWRKTVGAGLIHLGTALAGGAPGHARIARTA
jgi:hypothetical protein